MRRPGVLETKHLEMLEQQRSWSGGEREANIIAVTEAFLRAEEGPHLLAELPLRKMSPRVALVLARTSEMHHLRLSPQELVVYQMDWASKIKEVQRHLPQRLLGKLQQAVNSVHRQTFDSVTSALDGDEVSVTGLGVWTGRRDVGLSGRAALLLRGQTPEFHRPVSQVLREELSRSDQLGQMLKIFRGALSICPAELEPEALRQRLERDPSTWFLALVQFADRARVLGTLLDLACDAAPGRHKLDYVRASYRKWDIALCGGGTSDWVSTRTLYLYYFLSGMN
jgi:hypothetical protein